MMQFTVAALEAGVATLLSADLHLVHFPRLLLPADVREGAVVSVNVDRDTVAEQLRRREVEEVQETLLRDFGALPQLGEVAVAARTQHSITVTWTPPKLHGAVLKGIHVYRNRQHVRTLTADQRRVKLTGLEPGTAYEVTVVFHTTAARLTSPVLRVATRGPTDFSGICVAFSLFSAPEVAELRQLVDQLGGRYTDEFSPENTHLVCKAPAGTRYEQARHWNVPAVGPEWLRECIARGTFPAARQHYAERHEITAYFPPNPVV